jgi:hypothetical protein
MKQPDGVTVCASGFLGDGIMRMWQHNGEAPADRD